MSGEQSSNSPECAAPSANLSKPTHMTIRHNHYGFHH
jgi:hypothetical protein